MMVINTGMRTLKMMTLVLINNNKYDTESNKEDNSFENNGMINIYNYLVENLQEKMVHCY